MEAEMTYLLEEQARKLENAEMLIERLKREVMALSFSVELHDRAAEKARALWAEAHPDKAPEWLRREDLMVWLMDRVERAEAVKKSLTSALVEISGFSAYWKCLRGNEEAWENVWNIATDALISLRTAEESSVVDSTPAKQPDDSSNTDGDGDSVIDDNHMQVELDCEALLELIEKKLSQRVENIKKAISSPTLSPELAAIGRELVRLAEMSLGEVEE